MIIMLNNIINRTAKEQTRMGRYCAGHRTSTVAAVSAPTSLYSEWRNNPRAAEGAKHTKQSEHCVVANGTFHNVSAEFSLGGDQVNGKNSKVNERKKAGEKELSGVTDL